MVALVLLTHLLQGVHALGVDGVPGDDHDHGHVGVHQGQGSMLQLPSKDALARTGVYIFTLAPVEVGELLDFKGSL